MKKLLISAAALALLAAPAFAQGDNDHHDRGGRGADQHQGGGQQGGGQQGGQHMNTEHRGAANGAGVQHAAPATQVAPVAPQAAAPHATPQANSSMMRRGGGNDHQDNNRSNNNNANNNNNNNNNNNRGGMAGPNNGMRGPNTAMRGQGMGQNRPHVTNFNSYHRNFASARHYHAPAPYRRPQGWYSHRWTFGERLPALFFVRDYWIDDYYDFGLTVPPYGTEWVRYGDDALLVDVASGEVIQVVYGVYY